MRRLFLGKPLHWLMLAAAIVILYGLGANQFHRVDYTGFLLVILGLAAGCVALVYLTYRRGDEVTREPIDEQD